MRNGHGFSVPGTKLRRSLTTWRLDPVSQTAAIAEALAPSMAMISSTVSKSMVTAPRQRSTDKCVAEVQKRSAAAVHGCRSALLAISGSRRLGVRGESISAAEARHTQYHTKTSSTVNTVPSLVKLSTPRQIRRTPRMHRSRWKPRSMTNEVMMPTARGLPMRASVNTSGGAKAISYNDWL